MRAFAIDELGQEGAVRDLPLPEPGEGQVRVRVEAASVNPGDTFAASGAYKDFMPYTFPLIPGGDLAGTVDAVGPGVTGIAPGDAVFGVHGKPVVGQGSFAEAVVATTGTIARRPGDLEAAFAAALPVAGVSALELVDFVDVGPGDVVVVLGASGGIGGYVVPLLKAAGAIVVGVASGPNHRYVRDLGADDVIDYHGRDVADEVRSKHPGGAAAVIDLVGDRELAARAAELVGPGGRVASMVGGADVDGLAARDIAGVNVRTQITTAKLDRLAALVEDGTLRRPTITVMPLDQAGKALADCANRHVRGKLVLTP